VNGPAHAEKRVVAVSGVGLSSGGPWVSGKYIRGLEGFSSSGEIRALEGI